MPTLGSMCHGGICRVLTRSLMERAHGRASWYVMRDIGAIEFGWWHSWHFTCRIGATSFENVVCFVDVSAARAGAAITRAAPIASMPAGTPLHFRDPQPIMCTPPVRSVLQKRPLIEYFS